MASDFFVEFHPNTRLYNLENNSTVVKMNDKLVIVLRDFQIEKTLQTAIESGANIWVIGDVHGHFKTLESLQYKNYNNEDFS